MELKKQNLLFFTRTMKAGGTEKVILQLCEIFKPLVHKIVVCSNGGVNEEKLASMGIRHYWIPDIEIKNLYVVCNVACCLKKIIKKEMITVIHTHHRMAAFYVFSLKLYKKLIFINTSHNVFYNKKLLTKMAYRKGNLVACGKMVQNNLTDFFGMKEDRVAVIHNAVMPLERDRKEDQLIKELHCSGNYLVGNVGRLSAQKGMKYFIRAIPLILKEHANVRFLIIGSGEEEENLRALAEETGAEPYLYFMGYREDIQNLISQLDLLVLSSLWEGLPLTPIEAYSAGKTVVATAVDGTPEIVRDGIDGLLIPVRDSDAIAAKVNYLIDHPAVQSELEKNALERYHSEFTFEMFSDSYLAYYGSLEG